MQLKSVAILCHRPKIQSENHLGNLYLYVWRHTKGMLTPFLSQPKEMNSIPRQSSAETMTATGWGQRSSHPAWCNTAIQYAEWSSSRTFITLGWVQEQHQQRTAEKTVGDTVHTRLPWQQQKVPSWRHGEVKWGNTNKGCKKSLGSLASGTVSSLLDSSLLGPSQELLRVFLLSWIQRAYWRNHSPA